MATVDELAAKYGGAEAPVAATGDTTAIDALAEKYGQGNYGADFAADKAKMRSSFESAGAGLKQGALDVATSIGQGASFIANKIPNLLPSDEKNKAKYDEDLEALKKSRDAYNANYAGDRDANIGRFVGQTAATAPLIPGKVIQGVNAGLRALPTTLATGEKVAAPVLNRLGASAASGGVAGAVYGAATSSTNDESLASNVGTGLITGSIAGPAIMAGGSLASKVVNAAKAGWEHVNIETLARASGLSASSTKDIVERLKSTGLTPATAQVELTKLGPKATLMDLSTSLADEGGAIAALGDKSSTIVKNRMLVRADTANSDAVKLMETKLGPKPDVYVERGMLKGQEADNIHKEAQRLTKADYELAHKSSQILDAQPLIEDINKSLEGAVGAKANVLKTAKSYLTKTVGEDQVPKYSVSDLHEVRQGIDDLINNKAESLPGNALRAISQVRDKVDTLLKSNPEMLAADTKFAEKMKIKQGLQIGYDAINKGTNKEEFARTFDNASPEIKDTIKKGMRAAVGDAMEKNTQGELSGAQRLLDKKALNRANFVKAFGPQGGDILDNLHQEIAFRNTERSVLYNSKTAERQAIQARRQGEAGSGGGFVREALKGLAIDASTGSLGAATGVNVVRTGGRNILLSLSEGRLNRLNEGSADLLSRSGQARDNAMSVLEQVSKVRDKSFLSRQQTNIKLPVVLSGPLGQEGYKRVKGE